MNTPELERRVAVALKQHAEAAMSHTETDQAKLEGMLANAERVGRKRRLAWVAGGAVAGAAAALVGVWAMGLTSGSPDAVGPASPGPTLAVAVAAEYVDAYASYDRPLLKSLVAGDALTNWSSLDQSNRADEAMEFRVLLDHCTALDHSSAGTQVTCSFDVHALGSEQLGLGPYSNNQFFLTVRDGKIVKWQINFTFETNGFAVQMWEPFVAWLTQHYPKDVPRMIDGNNNPRPDATSVELFHQHIAAYVAAKSP